MHFKGEECLISRDVYKKIGYEEENAKKAIQDLVPSKGKLRFGGVKPLLNQWEDIFPLHKDTVLLKKPSLCCFLLKCKIPETKHFIEWAVETIFTARGSKISFSHLRKRCSTSICKIMTIKCKPFSMRTWHCKNKQMCIRPSQKNFKTPSYILKHVMFLMQEITVKATLSSLYENTQRLPTSIIICHIMLRAYNDAKGMLN